MTSPRLVAEQLFRAAVRSADPSAATRVALAQLDARSFGARPWIIAVGKGAVPMAQAAIDALGTVHRVTLGGVVVTADEDVPAIGPLDVCTGDHPMPGARSLAAAERIGAVVSLVRPGDDVLVLVSGGATSLMAAPVDGISPGALRELFAGLHQAGAPIDEMNAFRKRVLRWGAGRLALALAHARVTCLIASDVIGDDAAAIASGPCAGDRWSATELIELAQARRIWPYIPDEVRQYLDATLAGQVPETPRPTHEAIAAVERRVILRNADALEGVSREGDAAQLIVRIAPTPIAGNARSTGGAIARAALVARRDDRRGRLNARSRLALVWGGETTVALGAHEGAEGHAGTGGRAQELALAAAQVLHAAGAQGRGITILAAGTDGRDGPTDAAGAIVDGTTWSRIALAGLDPERALAMHDAYPALDAAGALLRTGLTGTNVNDVVIALVD